MSTWTKELPKESGFYWFRNSLGTPSVVEWEAESETLSFAGSDWPMPASSDDKDCMTIANTNGEFWAAKLEAPAP